MVEEMLKAGELPCLVATSSLELGIDMGAVDLVIQVESPKSVARGLQRIGRAGHSVGDVSRGRIFPKFRADLLECAVVARRMRDAQIETTVVPRNALDVLAQQIVAIAAAARRRPAGQRRRPVRAGHAHLQLRRAEPLTARERARHARRPLSVERVRRAAPADRVGPDRRDDPRPPGRPPAGGHQRRHDPRSRPVRRHPARRAPCRRARRGDGLRGAPRPDVPAGGDHVADRGDRPRPRDRHPGPRPARARCRSGRATRSGARRSSARRSARSRAGPSTSRPRCWSATTTSTSARPRNLLEFLAEQQQATRVIPSDRAIVVERFRDEIGDWRLCVLSPFGGRVHAAWSLALSARIRDEFGLESDAIYSDDGIIVHLPDAEEPPGAELVMLAARRDRGPGGRRAGLERAVRGPLSRERRPLAADPARAARQAHAAVAAAAEVPVAAGGGQEVRGLPGDPGDLPRVPARRARRARPGRAAHPAAPPRADAGRGGDPDRVAVRLRVCCSTTSPPTCTRATRPTPSAARRRCRSTATCCASCSARRSCAT